MDTLSHQHDHGKAHGHRRATNKRHLAKAGTHVGRMRHPAIKDDSAQHPRLHVLPLEQNSHINQSRSPRFRDANTRLVRHLRSVARALGVDLKKLEVSIGPTQTTLRYGAETGDGVHRPEAAGHHGHNDQSHRSL
jgi:hypothetical protein